ncbi:MAG TPA: hypothetical protein VN612_02080 [Acidobacteriaceae bacterium]|nr:hypothetical protein [Acidobacteriaceae bacterium]
MGRYATHNSFLIAIFSIKRAAKLKCHFFVFIKPIILSALVEFEKILALDTAFFRDRASEHQPRMEG